MTQNLHLTHSRSGECNIIIIIILLVLVFSFQTEGQRTESVKPAEALLFFDFVSNCITVGAAAANTSGSFPVFLRATTTATAQEKKPTRLFIHLVHNGDMRADGIGARLTGSPVSLHYPRWCVKGEVVKIDTWKVITATDTLTLNNNDPPHTFTNLHLLNQLRP